MANSLLGRSIFVRYLEDRGVLTEDYYRSFSSVPSESLSTKIIMGGRDIGNLFDCLAKRCQRSICFAISNPWRLDEGKGTST